MPLFLIPMWTFLKKISFEVWVVIAIVGTAILGIYTVDRNAVRRTTKKHEAEELRETIVLQETAKEVVDEIQQDVAHAEEAVSRYPYLRSRDELRRWDKDIADLVDPDREGHERGS